MDDLIRRQDAIDKDIMGGLNYERILREVPSAEPEIIYCKDCKSVEDNSRIADGRYWCVIHQCYMYYCSDAERRTDG